MNNHAGALYSIFDSDGLVDFGSIYDMDTTDDKEILINGLSHRRWNHISWRIQLSGPNTLRIFYPQNTIGQRV